MLTIIRYDGLTIQNQRAWLNTVTPDNLPFAKAAGSIITNYSYNLSSVTTVAQSKPLNLSAIYSGIDCWGQTDDSYDTPRRTNTRNTFGFNNLTGQGTGEVGVGRGHGGTATGLAVKALGGLEIGIGIFGHGWAYEHTSPGTVLDRYMWEGGPEFEKAAGKMTCRCHAGLPAQHLNPAFTSNPIKNHATLYPAGSDSFFYTDYKEVFVDTGDGKYRCHLNQQSVNPEPGARRDTLTLTPTSTVPCFMVAELRHDPSRCTVGVEIPQASSLANPTELSGKFTLHKLLAKSELNPDITISYRKLVHMEGLRLDLIVDVEGHTVPLTQSLTGQMGEADAKTISIRNTTGPITAIGLLIRGPAQSVVKALSNKVAILIDVYSLTLRPSGQSYASTEISDLKIEPHGTTADQANFHHRLVWDYKKATTKPSGLPFSNVTGPFSYFIVKADNVELGRAYTLGFIIDEATYKGWKTANKAVSFTVEGYGFDGNSLGSVTGKPALV